MKIIPFKLTIGSYADNTVAVSRQLPQHTRLAAFALTVHPFTAHLDHFLTQLRHADYDAISGDTSSTAGVPLSAVASTPRRVSSTSQAITAPGLSPWPGRYNDIEAILCEGYEQGMNRLLRTRLALAKALPRTRYPLTLWPLRPGKDFDIALRRFAGGATLQEAILWCVELPEQLHAFLCDLNSYPHWLNKKIDLAATGTVEPNYIEVRNEARDGYSLGVKQLLAAGYDDDGTPGFDESYLQAVSAHLTLERGEFLPDHGRKRVRLDTLCAHQIGDFDPGRDFQLLLREHEALLLDIEHSTTANAKGIYFTAYGLLHRGDSHVPMLDI